MKPRRTVETRTCYSLPGGNEDNDLWVEQAQDQNGNMLLCSYWVPTDEERQEISEGKGIELRIWGSVLPPVSMAVSEIREFKA